MVVALEWAGVFEVFFGVIAPLANPSPVFKLRDGLRVTFGGHVLLITLAAPPQKKNQNLPLLVTPLLRREAPPAIGTRSGCPYYRVGRPELFHLLSD